jgi:hypothetical protein
MHGYVRHSLVACMLSTCLGCGGGSSPSAAPTPDPFPYAGTWRQPSSATVRLSFTVTQNQITAMELGHSELIFIPPGTFMGCEASLTLVAPVAISANAFVAPVRNNFGTTNVRGALTSSTSASGTFDAWNNASGTCGGGFVIAGPNDGGAWQVTKQ